MDIASIIGLLGAIGMVLGAMTAGGGILPFVDSPAMMIVFGGTFFSVMYSTPMGIFIESFRSMGKAFKPPVTDFENMIERMVDLSGIARKEGLMALEGQPVPDPFFEKGLQMLVDGADEKKLVTHLRRDIKMMKSSHAEKQAVVKSWVDIAPAMGMIGTLIGLVQMLGNMADPKAIGPAMAVALLTTLYGTFIANVLFMPLLSKLEGATVRETKYREMVADGLRSIAAGENSRSIQEQMIGALPQKMQSRILAA